MTTAFLWIHHAEFEYGDGGLGQGEGVRWGAAVNVGRPYPRRQMF